MKCICPDNSALTSITAHKCGVDFGQIQYIIFQKLTSAESDSVVENGMVATIGSDGVYSVAESAFTTLLAKSDDTKVVVSPLCYNPSASVGEERTWGGGNATPDGKLVNIGRDDSSMSFELRKAVQSSIKQMKELQCFAENGELGAYLVDNNGQMKAILESTTSSSTTTYKAKPIPLTRLFVGDLQPMGLEEPDMNVLTIGLGPDWSDDTENFGFIKPSQVLADVIAAQ